MSPPEATRKARGASHLTALAQRLGSSTREVSALRRTIPALHRWYHRSARDLPWRRTRDPYAIWISEAMLQQTQVATVLPYFERWMGALPSLATLAAASEDVVLRLWEGLGYYSRARNLHRAARQVVDLHGGEIPRQAAVLRDLPGVGPYTTAAVMSIAFDEDLPVVDGNVRRVLSRLVALDEDPRRPPWSKALEDLARALLPAGTAAIHNQALMELGALCCTPRSPDCPRCPLSAPCRARAAGEPERFPRAAARSKPPRVDEVVAFLVYRGKVLLRHRPSRGLLGGLWELPGRRVERQEDPRAALRRELLASCGLRVKVMEELPAIDQVYTHLRVVYRPFRCRLQSSRADAADSADSTEEGSGQWVPPGELTRYALPRAMRRVIGLFLGGP